VNALETDGRGRPVATHHLRGVVEHEQLFLDGVNELRVVAARQIRSPNGTHEKRVADEEKVADLKTYATWRMPGRVANAAAVAADGEVVAVGQAAVDMRGAHCRESEHLGLLGEGFD